MKRYSLVLPEGLFEEIKKAADERHTTVMELIRKFIKLGLVILELEKKPDFGLFLREGEGKPEQKVFLL